MDFNNDRFKTSMYHNITPNTINGKYIPPNMRKKKGHPRLGRMLVSGIETMAPDTKNCALFPYLSKPIIENKSECKDTYKPSFVSITAEKEAVPKEKKKQDILKPGWVRLFRGRNGEFMQEFGPIIPRPESESDRNIRDYEQHKAYEYLTATLARNIASSREMDPYYDAEAHDADEDDYDNEDDDDDDSDNEYSDDCDEGDY